MKLFSEITQRFPVNSISSERKSDNKEIGLEANESKQIKLQMLNNEFREFYSPQKPANTKIKTQSDLKTWY